MPKITFKFVHGESLTVDVLAGTTILQAAHDNKVDLEGSCGGSLACSTCHVVVDQEWFNRLPEPSEDEQDMLDLAFNPTQTSRLGCQVIITPELDGLVVLVPTQNRNFISH